MKNNNYLFTSESVSEGHPDKIADRVSDAVLDAYLKVDPYARVACETLITKNQLIISGETSASATPEKPLIEIAREVIRKIGYTDDVIGFNCDTAVYTDHTHTQSREISASVEHGGAGDQGLMFGYACNDTPDLMPMAITIAHKLMKRQAALRHTGKINWLLPDAKSQVTVKYNNQKCTGIDSVVLSTQHRNGISQEEIKRSVIDEIILPVIHEYFPDGNPNCLVNPSGSFTIGGPFGDTGLTGRKIIVDTYGGSCPHGGGAFSGKDASKVDRSGAYIARYVAKHIVAAKIANRCTVQIAYAIGVAEPVSVYINFHGTSDVDESVVLPLIRDLFDLTPKGIIKVLGLHNPVYYPTSAYGHFGNDSYNWEKLDDKIIERLMSMLD